MSATLTPGARRRWTRVELAQLAAMRAAGRSIEYMAAELHRTAQSVYAKTSRMVRAERLTDGRKRNRPGKAISEGRTRKFCADRGFPADRIADYRLFRRKGCPPAEAAALVRQELRA